MTTEPRITRQPISQPASKPVSQPNFAPNFTSQPEEITATSLTVEGTLPAWLEGTLVRNGPGQFEVNGQSYRHWFDGLAFLKAFSFGGGEVTYTSRYLRTPAYYDDNKNGRITYRGFAVDPCMSMLKRTMTMFMPDRLGANTVVNVTRMGERFLAMTEAPIAIEFDPHTLATIGDFDYETALSGNQTATAHPHYSPDEATAYNYHLHFGAMSAYEVYAMQGSQRQRMAHIPVARPAYIHSFGMTENYIVLAEFSLRLGGLRDLVALAAVNRPFIENFTWHPEQPSRFLVIDRKTGTLVHTAETEAFFAFHHVNAYESDARTLHIDIAAYDDPAVIDGLYLDALRSDKYPHKTGELRRYTVMLGERQASYETLGNAGIELPRINYAYNGQAYRYAYGVSLQENTRDFVNQLVKIDTQDDLTTVWHKDGHYPSEPIFIASPDAQTEDDGVLLSVVYDSFAHTSYLLVLDAETMQEIARAEAPQRIPFDFHGQFWRDV
jgi:beta,beta-carotene 9',10'-dioxygenase